MHEAHLPEKFLKLGKIINMMIFVMLALKMGLAKLSPFTSGTFPQYNSIENGKTFFFPLLMSYIQAKLGIYRKLQEIGGSK